MYSILHSSDLCDNFHCYSTKTHPEDVRAEELLAKAKAEKLYKPGKTSDVKFMHAVLSCMKHT
jgi:hypothetical protein